MRLKKYKKERDGKDQKIHKMYEYDDTLFKNLNIRRIRIEN